MQVEKNVLNQQDVEQPAQAQEDPRIQATRCEREQNENLISTRRPQHDDESAVKLRCALQRVHTIASVRDALEDQCEQPRQRGTTPKLQRSTSLVMLQNEFPHASIKKLASLDAILAKANSQCLQSDDKELTFARFFKDEVQLWNPCSRSRRRKKLRTFSVIDVFALILLSLVLLLTAAARVHLNSLAGSIIATDTELGYSTAEYGLVLYFAAIGAAIGRLITGLLIDLYNPILMLSMFIVGSSIAVTLLSQFNSVTSGEDRNEKLRWLRALNAICAFFYSGIFASIVRYIHSTFRPSQWGIALVIVAVGQKLGLAITVLSMGAIVSRGLEWQQGSLIAACMCFGALIPTLAVALMFPVSRRRLEISAGIASGGRVPSTTSQSNVQRNGSDTNLNSSATCLHGTQQRCSRVIFPCTSTDERQRRTNNIKIGLKRLVYWWQRPPFVLIAIANACMSVTFSPEGFDGLAPLFTNQALHSGRGIPTASILVFYQIGALCSLIIGAIFLERLARPAQSGLTLFLMTITSAALGGLIALTKTAETSEPTVDFSAEARAIYFFTGFGMGYPVFVIVPKFAINFGGENSALMVQTLGLFGLAVCATAYGIFGILVRIAWLWVIVVVFGSSIIAVLAMMLFDFYEWRMKNLANRIRVMHAVAELIDDLDVHQDVELNGENQSPDSERNHAIMQGDAEIVAPDTDDADDEPGALGKEEDARGNMELETKPIRTFGSFVLIFAVFAGMFVFHYLSRVRQ